MGLDSSSSSGGGNWAENVLMTTGRLLLLPGEEDEGPPLAAAAAVEKLLDFFIEPALEKWELHHSEYCFLLNLLLGKFLGGELSSSYFNRKKLPIQSLPN